MFNPYNNVCLLVYDKYEDPFDSYLDCIQTLTLLSSREPRHWDIISAITGEVLLSSEEYRAYKSIANIVGRKENGHDWKDVSQKR